MADIDWTSINEKLPYQRTEEQKTKRRELFNQFDPNGNGYLSLAEVLFAFFHEFFSPLYQLISFSRKFYRLTRECEMSFSLMNYLIANR